MTRDRFEWKDFFFYLRTVSPQYITLLYAEHIVQTALFYFIISMLFDTYTPLTYSAQLLLIWMKVSNFLFSMWAFQILIWVKAAAGVKPRPIKFECSRDAGTAETKTGFDWQKYNQDMYYKRPTFLWNCVVGIWFIGNIIMHLHHFKASSSPVLLLS